jgi:Sec7-like guanine-nucleotide exchange factor
MAFEHVSQIYNTRFGVVISQGAFADLIVCLTEFSKNTKFQKKSLQAIETLKSSVPKMLKTPECPLSHKHSPDKPAEEIGANLAHQLNRQTKEEQFWYPVLIAFQDVLMTGDDLEVRSRSVTTHANMANNLLTRKTAEHLTICLIYLFDMAAIFHLTSGTCFGGNCYTQSLSFFNPSQKCQRCPTTKSFLSGYQRR